MKHIAQALRRNQIDAERLLWARLRARRLHGFKFRRQAVLGHYVVDFACLEPKLVIEVDGGQHAEQAPKDAARTEYLEALGYRVIRFWNDEVLQDPDAVLEEIARGLIEIPSPYPLPEGEGKKEKALSRRDRERQRRSWRETEKKQKRSWDAPGFPPSSSGRAARFSSLTLRAGPKGER